jgi:hypothetical protein
MPAMKPGKNFTMTSFAIASILLALTITFDGPTELDTPQTVTVDVSGFPPLSSDQPLDAQINAVLGIGYAISAPDESEARLRSRLFFEPSPEGLRLALELRVTLDKPGVYVIIGPDVTYHRITVGGLPDSPVLTTAAIYVYEKDHGPVPAALGQALHKLNQEHAIHALAVDQDVGGTGQTRVAIDAARAAGLPALVLLNNGIVTKIIRNPSTEEHVYEHVLTR